MTNSVHDFEKMNALVRGTLLLTSAAKQHQSTMDVFV